LTLDVRGNALARYIDRLLALIGVSDPLLRVVLVIREEYLPALEAVGQSAFQHFDTRYHLLPLEEFKAVEVLRLAAEAAGRPFAAGVAESIASSLASQSVNAERAEVSVAHLQLVSHAMWNRLPAETSAITQELVEAAGDPRTFLREYYDKAMVHVSTVAGVPEARLRNWIERELITPAGTRNVVGGAGVIGRFSERTLQALSDEHLIRGEYREGTVWYELSSELLISVVPPSNAEWVSKGLGRRVLWWLSSWRRK
jgi:hypothetical protein